jgi:hypothetical protein
VSDFNGRIAAIVHACTADGARVEDMRYKVRAVLREEHADGWKEGYSDAREDGAEQRAAEREAATADDTEEG